MTTRKRINKKTKPKDRRKAQKGGSLLNTITSFFSGSEPSDAGEKRKKEDEDEEKRKKEEENQNQNQKPQQFKGGKTYKKRVKK